MGLIKLKRQWDTMNKLRYANLIAIGKMNPSFEKNFIKNPVDMTDALLGEMEDIKHTKKDAEHLKIIGYGASGTGKTLTGLTLAYFLDLNGFVIKNQVFYDTREILDALSKIKAGSVIFKDEKRNMWGEGQTATLTEFNNLAEQCRDMKISIIALANSKYDFEYHYAFQGIAGFISVENDLCRSALWTKHTDGGAYCLGYIDVTHPKNVLGPEQMKDYQKLKLEKGYERMHQLDGNYYDKKIQVLLEFCRAGETEPLINQIAKLKNNNLSHNMLMNFVNEVFPSLNYDIRSERLVTLLKYKVDTGVINIGGADVCQSKLVL